LKYPKKAIRRNSPAADSLPLSNEKSQCMFTRVVELTTKPGKSKLLADTIDDKALLILKKQRRPAATSTPQ
jgi:hypothetical protein